MKQSSFSEAEYAGKMKRTRRDRFLDEMDTMTPWATLVRMIEPHYSKEGRRGRPPVGVGTMLLMYVAQQCFGLSDEGIENLLYDSQAIRRFVGIDLIREDAPDATMLLKFRRLLETHELTDGIFNAINAHLLKKGWFLRRGTIVNATIIAVPSSTKNEKRERDPEMHQTKKGKQWHFGMKAHIGVDAESRLTYAVISTAANVSDVTQIQALLHRDETDAFGDTGFLGVEKREGNHGVPVTWHIAMRAGKRRALPEDEVGEKQELLEQIKASVRTEVKHPLHVVKNLFHHRKTRYRGLLKNMAQLLTLFGLTNLVLARRWLSASYGGIAS